MLPLSPRLIVEPDDGLDPVREFINSAQNSLLIKQFTFTEPSLIAAVIDRKNAGVDVRVMLNAARSGGDRANDETYQQFIEKYFTPTRNYGVITENPYHVAQIVEVFNADWDERDWDCSAYEGLLWSNSNSRYHMAQFIDTATERLDIQHPKYVDAVILERLAAAADRGVKVHVLCGGKHGISEWDILDTFASLRTLKRFGVKVHKQKNLRVHAKLIIVDNAHALVGSMNIDRSAFDLRRELGIMTSDPAVVGRLKAVFDSDWELSHHYEAPDPLDPSQHHEDDFPHDHDLMHE
jgi:cardiolipin synthase A/B